MAARTEAETFGNAPGTLGIPKLKARRFGFDRESNQRALSPPSEWCEGQTLAWLKSCWQKELIRSRCETAVLLRTGLSAPLRGGAVMVAADAKAVIVSPSLFWYLGLPHYIYSSKGLLQRCLDMRKWKKSPLAGRARSVSASRALTLKWTDYHSIQTNLVSADTYQSATFLGKREVGVCFSCEKYFP